MDKEEALAREWCKQNGYVMMPEAVYEQDITKAYFEGQNTEPCEDAISRADAISLFKDDVAAVNELMQLESVQPKVCECEDAISRVAAIKAMNDLEQEDIERYGCSIPEGFDGKRAIEALKKLPSVTPKQNDVLEKIRTVINEPAIYDEYSKRQNDYCDGYEFMRKRIKEIVDAEPKQKMGHWILTDDDFVYCSECEDSYYPRPIDASWYYCPHCGAKMAESEEV